MDLATILAVVGDLEVERRTQASEIARLQARVAELETNEVEPSPEG